jgi:uridine kinase
VSGSYADLAVRVLRRPPRLGRTRLVCVDGPSGAGKTEFAAALAGALRETVGAPVPVVHTDDLLAGWPDQFTFWGRLERQVLAPVRAGSAGRYRPYDWRRGRFGDTWVSVPAGPVLVVEGVSSARAEIRPEASLTVFVTAPMALRRERALARDGAALLASLERWWREEERHFAADATAGHVDLVVDGAAANSTGFQPVTPSGS